MSWLSNIYGSTTAQTYGWKHMLNLDAILDKNSVLAPQKYSMMFSAEIYI